ncbi:MAG: nitroreductase [Candidatus Eremiobacteraeota bacterium]|nr:nitroreductase [Candidatus Eremiobacteraeota bacterium]
MLELDRPSPTVAEALETRRSTRAFLSTPVSRETIVEILRLASRAPSGSNIQPWRVHVVTGEPLRRLGDAMQRAYLADEPGHAREYDYYTDPLFEPYLGRRRACGWGLYGLLGIARGEKDRMKAQRAKNYNFFGAPVGMVFSIDKRLEIGSWMDYGMFLQSIMLAARGFGLHTCPQASIAEFPRIVRSHLAIGDDFTVVCGMALGYRDPQAEVNGFQPERLEVEEFATFV